MWAVISGADGSGKAVIAEWFVREDFQNKSKKVLKAKDEFHQEMLNSANYTHTALECADMMHGANVFSIRSLWENGEIFLPLARKFQEITVQEYETGIQCYNLIKSIIPAPSCFVYCKIDARSAMDRAMLKGESFHQDKLKAMINLYDEMFEKINIPVLEIDMTKSIDQSLKDLDYAVQSIKASGSDNQSIWKRTVF